MSISDFIKTHREKIVFLGLGVGMGSLLGFLPETIPLADTYTEYLYMGLIALAGYIFYEHYYKHPTGVLNIKRTVESRNLSDPLYQEKLRKSHSAMQKPAEVPIPETPMSQQKVSKDSEVFNQFNTDK